MEVATAQTQIITTNVATSRLKFLKKSLNNFRTVIKSESVQRHILAIFEKNSKNNKN